MPQILKNSTLGDILVKEAMRRQIVSLNVDSSISSAIRNLIKYKISALLVIDGEGRPAGVVSKTDIVGAYYAGLPSDTTVENIMVGPPLFCLQDQSLETALGLMRSSMVYRLYVTDRNDGEVLGVLAYPDIVALLYVYCRGCEQSATNRRRQKLDDSDVIRIRVKDVMTPKVVSYSESDTLSDIIEGMSQNRFSAVLIKSVAGLPTGVISKTDLMLAYNHGLPVEEPSITLLKSHNVRSCDEEEFIEDAIREMVFSELHRLFVHRGDIASITGVLSLSDLARFRSGSCHACVGARITIK